MSYVVIRAGGVELVMTPEVVKEIVESIKPQVKQMNFAELMATVNALGIPLPKLVALLKGSDHG